MIEGLSEASLELERLTGYDSIPTIIRVYEEERGYFLCCYPTCRFKRQDPELMWFHVHAGTHGQSFGMNKDTILEKIRNHEVIRPR